MVKELDVSENLVIDVQNLAAAYGPRPVLRDLSMTVPAGAMMCMLGPNGAGKSTLLRILCGQQLADAGRVIVAGVDVRQTPEVVPAVVGYVPQDVVLWDELTAAETLETVCRLRQVPAAEVSGRVAHWLDATFLATSNRGIARDFSGGMRRKLAVAAAMIAQPPCVVLDESFVGLDPESTLSLQREIRRYCAQGGTVLLSSHVLDMVEEMASHLVFVKAGQVVRSLSGDEFRSLLSESGQRLGALYMHVIHGEPLQPDPRSSP